MKKWLKTVGLLQHIDLECNSGLGSETIRKIIRTELKKADKNNDGFIDKQEFLDLVMDKSLDQNMALDKHAFMTYLKGVASISVHHSYFHDRTHTFSDQSNQLSCHY